MSSSPPAKSQLCDDDVRGARIEVFFRVIRIDSAADVKSAR